MLLLFFFLDLLLFTNIVFIFGEVRGSGATLHGSLIFFFLLLIRILLLILFLTKLINWHFILRGGKLGLYEIIELLVIELIDLGFYLLL
jgi:hypothetical protein